MNSRGMLILRAILPILLVRMAVGDDDTLYFDKAKPNLETQLTAEDFERARYSKLHLRLHSSTYTRLDERADAALYRRDRFEGDIIGVDALSLLQHQPHQFQPSIVGQHPRGVFRSAVRNRFQTWPTRRIPYTISTQYSSFSRSRIASALDEYSKKTCVRFVPRTNERDYIFIAPDDGCYSTIGRAGGRQVVSIGSGCVNFGIIIHELMHSVGFFHEQSRPDRDEYVMVNWTNVAEDMKDQFIKYNYGMINTMGFLYDYGSVMHYSNRAFTKNGEPTLLPRTDGVKIGQRDGFSQLDATKINALYSCDDSPPPSSPFDPAAAFEHQITTTTDFPSPLPSPPTPPSIPPPPPPPPSQTPCTDAMEDCLYRKSLGYCDTIPHWMTRYCKKTCGVCIVDEEPPSATVVSTPASAAVNARAVDDGGACVDTLPPHCPTWAKSGFCTGHASFVEQMRKTCKKTCGFC